MSQSVGVRDGSRPASHRLRNLLVLSAVVLVLGQSAGALAPGSGMRPLVRMGPQESLATAPGGPQYGLFTCQVGLSTGQCYDPYQMRAAYGLDSLIAAGYDGAGQTIVIIDAFSHPNLAAQMAMFDNFYGLPLVDLTVLSPDGVPPVDPGWAEEISLDVEWSHAIAPGARIVLVQAKSNYDEDLISALNYAIDQNLGSAISMSFGENESCLDTATAKAWHDAFAKATLMNISLFASSADQGAALPTCDENYSWVKAVSSPASDPLVTSVGGTELRAADYCLASLGCDPTAHPAPGAYQSEIVWNEGLPYGDFGNVFGYGTIATGGGYSVVYDEPPYQKATIPGGKQRAVPDVAYNAAILHGVLTWLQGIPGVGNGWYRFGGTSAGAPQWAAIAAIANHKAGKQLGFLNSAIYHAGKVKKSYPVSFHDITSGTNSALEFDYLGNPVDITGYSAGTNWDATTGVGSPLGMGVVDKLIAYVSPGDGVAAVNTTKPKPNPKPVRPGHVQPH